MRQEKKKSMLCMFNSKIELIFLFILFAGCNKDVDKCMYYEKAPVSNIESNKTGQINEDVDVKTYFGCVNGCGQFGNFSENISDNTVTITVNTKYEGCVCTQVASTIVATYKFKTSQAGTYYLKFFQTGNSYLVDTLTIQ